MSARGHCHHCGTPLGEALRGGAAAQPPFGLCTACGILVFAAADGPAVLVAHDSDEMCQEIGRVLHEEALWPVRAKSGDQAWELHVKWQFAALVLDVGLSGLSPFTVVDRVRRSPALAGTKIVLLASVFNRTAYKRRPTSLYGADDYVEQHHIPDLLPAKLAALLGRPTQGRLRDLREAAQRIDDAQQRSDLRGRLRVRALAQAVVADIALYNERELRRALDAGDPGPLEPALAEGRRVLAELAHQEEYPSPDPVMDAFTILLQQVRADDE